MRVKAKTVFLLLALIFVSAFNMTAYGSAGESEEPPSLSMIVNASWLDDEMLRIDVIDIDTGVVSSLAVRLSDFVTDEDVGNSPYIMIQATDLDGNLSGVVRINNPSYVPADPAATSTANTSSSTASTTTGSGGSQWVTLPGQVESGGSYVSGGDGNNVNDANNSGVNNINHSNANHTNGSNVSDNDITGIGNGNTNAGADGYGHGESYDYTQLGLTPDGTGTVVDNIVTQNALEFFTVFTEAGNVFYLVVDRQRSTENVYLLNAVTEADLMALAESGGGSADNISISGIPTPIPTEPQEEEQNQTSISQSNSDNDSSEQEDASSGGGNGSLIFIAIIAVVIGAAGYYFKIVKGKRSSSGPDDDYWDDEGEDENGDEDYIEYMSDDTHGGGTRSDGTHGGGTHNDDSHEGGDDE